MKRTCPAPAVAFAAASLLGIILLAGCTPTDRASDTEAPSAAAPTTAGPSGIVSATPEPGKPKEPAEPVPSTPPGDAKRAYTDDTTGAPVVEREGDLPVADRAAAKPVDFSSPASYPDGVRLTTGEFTRGVVTAEGAGIITGAPFIVVSVTLENDSPAAIELSSVVATLKYGPETIVAAPLYDDVTVSDFAGTLAAGASQTAIYAFQVPKEQKDATLYVDLDGARLPAEFTGVFPE